MATRENILAKCRKLVSEQGLAAVNMRTVAKECDLALGSVYYYFSSKDDLLIDIIESVWEDIFSLGEDEGKGTDFLVFIENFFQDIKQGIRCYPNFFSIHSLAVSAQGQQKASNAMQRHLSSVRERMLSVLSRDPNVKAEVFTASFTPEEFCEFILMSLVALLVQRKDDCAVLLELIRRTLY